MAELFCPVCSRNIGDDRFYPDGFVCPACEYIQTPGAEAAPTGEDITVNGVEYAPVTVDPSQVQS